MHYSITDSSMEGRVKAMRDQMAARKNDLRDVNDTLPKENG